MMAFNLLFQRLLNAVKGLETTYFADFERPLRGALKRNLIRVDCSCAAVFSFCSCYAVSSFCLSF